MAGQPGWDLTKKLLPWMLVVPPVLALLRWYGERAGLFGLEHGVIVLTLALMFALTILVVAFARGWNQTEVQRRQASEETDRFFSLSRDLLLISDTEGNFKRINGAWKDVLGYSLEELKSRPYLDYVHPDDVENTIAEINRQLAGGPARPVENRWLRKDGSYRWLRWESMTFPEQGMAYATGRDVTEQKRRDDELQAQRLHLASVLAEASDPFVQTDEHGIITEWNRRAEEVFGRTAEEAVGCPVAETIVPERLRAEYWPALQRVLDGGEARALDEAVEIPALHRDGREIPVELAVWRVRYRDSVRFNAFVRDITARKETERALAQARDAAIETSRLKSQFLASVSHEIRTPLNGVLGLTEMLLDTQLDGGQRRYVKGIESAGSALLSVINDILDFSKIEAGKLVLDEVDFDLTRVIEGVAELMAEPAASKGLELISDWDPEVPTTVRGDPDRLRQILLNLTSNAVKFTSEGEVVLRVSAGASDGETVPVTFEVTDTGPGIAEQDRQRLFEPFQQADSSTTRRFGGTGLGLAICKELADAMNGRIGVDSRIGEGSTFWLTLPLPPRPDSSAPAGSFGALRGLRVLVVDDNETNRIMLIHQLQSWSMNPAAAENGHDAMTKLKQAAGRGQPYDLAVLDMHMPGLDGTQLAQRISQHPDLTSLRMVLLTSGATVDVDAAHQAGILATLTKPVHRSQLYDCLVRALTPSTGAETARTAPEESETPTVTRGLVLVAEDNEINQTVALAMLAKLGYRTELAGNGQEALEMTAERPYDVVLMDCQMPVLDGYAATAEIRRREEGGARRTPIVAMTAGALEEDRDRCLAAGMDDHLPKPINAERLAAMLAIWVGEAPAARPQVPDGEVTSREVAIRQRFDELHDGMPGDDVVLSRLATSFVSKSPGMLAELAETVRHGDPDGATRAAHGLKGAASNIGATALAELCETAETTARAGEVNTAADLLPRIEAELTEVRAVLDHLQQELSRP